MGLIRVQDGTLSSCCALLTGIARARQGTQGARVGMRLAVGALRASLELDGVSADRASESVLTRWLGTALRLLRSSA